MLFLQIPTQDDIAKDIGNNLNNMTNGWTQFWQAFINSPLDALKGLGAHALGIAVKIALAFIVFYVGRWVIRKLKKVMARIFEKKNVDSSVQIFLNNLVSIVLGIMLIVLIVAVLGIPMTGLVAIFAAAAFAIGMALSGTLSNFAGGVIILLQKPYRIGDYIEAQGYGGTVKAIQLFSTIMTTPDNKTIVIPNGPLSTGSINNFSRQNTRRVEWIIGVSYGDDFDRAKKLIQKILENDARVIQKLGTTIAINELTSSAVNIVIRCWVRSGDFWDVYFDINRQLYVQLPASGIVFPFSQVNVTLTQAQPPAQVTDAKD